MNQKKFSKVACSLLTAVLVTVPNLPFNVFSQPLYAEVSSSISLEDIDTKDGIIIQMHTWSFNNIRSVLPQLAQAGFKAVQVSPIQANKSGNEWWILYQPLNQEIGNDLGTRDEFKALCEEAEAYDIDIIVDAVLNHVANSGDNADAYSDNVWSEFKNYDYYHHQGQCSNWKSREAVTQQGIGMPDLNTQHPEVQQMAIDFLNDCIACGADGFRFDAAKHIETNIGEDQGQSWSGDYWSNVLGSLSQKDDLFLYGEVLDESNSESDNLYAYDQFMTITDHYYGDTLRNAVTGYYMPTAQNWNLNLSSNHRVSYVENHDHYEHAQSTSLSDTQRRLAWGFLAARDDVTPMYLSRRTGAVGSQGSTDFMNEEIMAVNWFHNAMVGESEYLRYANGNSCALVDRGTKGTAIINTGGDFYLDSETNLEDGTYTDKGGSGASFTVSNGRITGNVPSSRIVVLYDGPVNDVEVVTVSPEEVIAGEEVTITYDATGRVLQSSSNVTLHYGYDDFVSSLDAQMQSIGENQWQVTITVPDEATESLDFCFTDGINWDNNASNDWHYTVVEKVIEEVNVDISPSGTSFIGSIELELTVEGADQGTYAINGVTQGTFNNGEVITIGEDAEENSEIIVTVEAQNEESSDSQSYTYTKKSETATSATAYFVKPSDWASDINIYIYDDTQDKVKELAQWPGISMDYVSGDTYRYTLPTDWTYAKLIFNDGTNQVPGSGESGVEITSTDMIYEDNIWEEYIEEEIEECTVYFDNSTYNWDTIYAYVYDESGSSVLNNASWPGLLMTDEGNDIWSYTLTEDWDEARVIFTNGQEQIPAANQTGYEMVDGMILSNGEWIEY